MKYLDILREKVEATKKDFGGSSGFELTCDEVLGLIQAAESRPTQRPADGLVCPGCGDEWKSFNCPRCGVAIDARR